MTVLVVGYGNPSRMDDGVGHHVINQLNLRWGLPSVGLLGEPTDGAADVGGHLVRTLWVQQLDMGLAEDAAAAERLVFVDAHVGDEPEVVVELRGDVHFGVTSHVLTPDTVVELAGSLFGHRPRAWRCSVRGERWDFGAGLSPEVLSRCDALVERLATELVSADGLAATAPEACDA